MFTIATIILNAQYSTILVSSYKYTNIQWIELVYISSSFSESDKVIHFYCKVVSNTKEVSDCGVLINLRQVHATWRFKESYPVIIKMIL